jgi:formylglycine-generating enzyme required for sulfatase activity
MRKIFLILLFFSFLFLVRGIAEEANLTGGTLIVTYHTGPKGERLERVRFRVKGEDHQSQLYPKRNAFVDDPTLMNRTVVISNMPPGKYSVEFIVPNIDQLFDAVPTREVTIIPGKILKIDQAIKPKYGSIKATTSLHPEGEVFETPPTLTLRYKDGKVHSQSIGGKFSHTQLLPGQYVLVFEPLKGLKAPAAIELAIGPNESMGPIEGIYTKEDPSDNNGESLASEFDEIQKTVMVPAGKVIIGDPFEDPHQNELPKRIARLKAFYIGAYQVTNAQFAQWLNSAWSEGKIIFHTEPDQRGYITDLNNRLLFKTLEADSTSQIYTHSTPQGIHFLPIIGKHNYPVINVSWYGAQTYCQAYQFRLPTEAEWEKAGGMENTQPNQSLKKYKYGFSRDFIDNTYANYKDSTKHLAHFQVLTSRVGFYNGINKVLSDDKKEVSTHLAKSPAGAFDMSGNVWEWVSDWYDDQYYKNMPEDNPQGPTFGDAKVAKGGCYDSFAEGVRVAERIGLPPDHTDPYTGFRVAADKN